MASFRERYEELFGPVPDYDPIELEDRTQKRALDIQTAAPSASPAPRRTALPMGEFVGGAEEQGVLGNLADLTKTGTAMGAEALVGGVEYAARQLAPEEPGAGQEFLGDVASGLQETRGELRAYRENIYDMMPPDAIEKKGSEFLTLDPSKTIWKGGPLDVGEAVLYKFWESLPMMVGTIIPGAVMMRLKIPGAITYLGASEGGLSVGFIANDITDGIMQMPEEELIVESPRYAELLQTMDSPEAARDQLIREAQGLAPLIGGVAVGAISAAAGRFLQPVITGKAGLGRTQRAVRGAASEGLAQEGPQESVEQLVGNIAAAVYDGDRSVLEGLAESYVQGAAIGAPGGAGVAVLAGTAAEAPVPGEPDLTPEERDRPGAPSSFRDVFGEQVPPPGGYTGAPGDMFAVGETGDVDPAIAAAVSANIREDDVMEDMIENIESATPEARAQQQLPLGTPPPAPGQEVATVPGPPGQQQLPLQQRQPGVGRQDVRLPEDQAVQPEIPAAPTAPGTVPTEQQGELFGPQPPRGQPPQAAGVAGPTAAEFPAAETDGFVVTMTDDAGNVIEEDIFETAEEASAVADELADGFPDANINVTRTRAPRQVPAATPVAADQPSAEPLADIQAQLQDLADPTSGREGVFLSADNVARLQADQVRDLIGDTGVHLPNFDGEGGLLIAKNDAVAQSAIELRDEGFPMQYILGTLTQSGFEKPIDGQAVVQLRDDTDNVIRETVTATEDEAYDLADQWDYEHKRSGYTTAVMTPAASLARRQRLIATEREQLGAERDEQEAARRSRRAIEELPAEEQAEAEEAVVGAKKPSRAAARLVGLAVKKGAKEERQRIGGFFPPNALEFANDVLEQRYRGVWEQLVENQLKQEEITAGAATRTSIKRRAELAKEENKLFERLGKIRQLAKPKRKTTRVVKAAKKVDVSTVSALAPEVSKKATKIDISRRDYLKEEFAPLDRDAIDALEGEELTDAFANASYWLAGLWRDLKLSPEWRADNPNATDQEIAAELHKGKGDPFEALVAKYTTPGQQKKVIRRANVTFRRRAYGGKIAARDVTAKAKGERTTTAGYPTGPLTRDVVPQDESVADELKRKARSTKARKELGTAVRQSGKFILRLENDRSAFGKAFTETYDKGPKKGQLKLDAGDVRFARAYFVALNEFAMSLIESGQQTGDANLVMERLNLRLKAITKLSPKAFVSEVSRMARADEQSSLLTIGNYDVREQVTDPAERAKTIDKYYAQLVNTVQARERMKTKWETNFKFRNSVGPLMQKFVDSIAVDGWPSYRPNEMEMMQLQAVMRNWRIAKKGTARKDLYDPLKRFFRGVGIEFAKEKKKGAGGDVIIPRDEDGNYKWSPSDEALETKVRQRLGAAAAATTDREGVEIFGPVRFAQTVEEFNAPREAVAPRGPRGELIPGAALLSPVQQAREAGAREADLREDNRQRALVVAVNRAITALVKVANNSKSTLTKLATAEQNFIRKMKQLGVWQDTPSPAVGRIMVGTARTYRRVAQRMLEKKISKADARKSMASLKTYPIPKGLERPTLTVPQAERELDLSLKIIDPQANAEEFNDAATAVGDLLGDRTQPSDVNSVLGALLENLPENHIYRTLATKLLALDMQGIEVSYDWAGDLVEGESLGRFSVRKDGRTIRLNRKQLNKQRDEGTDPSAAVIHTLLHEMVHAATYQALRSNPHLAKLVMQLREYALPSFDLAKLPYGLQDVMDEQGNLLVDEFIAEAFSNVAFQNSLKKIYLDGRTLWRRLLDIVRSALGLPDSTPVSVMDVIMSLESQLFAGAGTQTAAGNITLDMDGSIQPYVSKALDSLNTGVGSMKGFWDRVRPPLMAMTMEQLRDTYSGFFGGKAGPLRQYMDAFFKRNAMNTKLMQEAEKLTRQWTALNEESDAAVGDEFSAIATDATMGEIAIQKPLTDKANKHLSSTKQKVRYKELRKRYNALPDGYKKLYTDLQGYYKQTLEREVDLMLFNAMRGLLTRGDSRVITKEEFESKYTLAGMRKFDTPEKFNEEFGQYFEEDQRKDMLSTLNQMAHVRQRQRGDYFPLKRYGDYVVYSEKRLESKSFGDIGEAKAYAAERRADDPTLTIGEYEDENGNFNVTVTVKDYRTAETATKAAEIRAEMVELYGEGDHITPVQKKRTQLTDAAITSNVALGSILASLKGNVAAQAAIKQFYLDSLADSSFRKHEMKRQNRRGVETDVQLRNFTVYAKQSSYYTAQLKFGNKMAEGMAEMQKFVEQHRDESKISSIRLGEVFEELQKRDKMMADPDEIMKMVKKSVEFTQFMMLTSPSYWMINASQPWMVTLPWLTSKYGLGASLSALKNAQGLIIDPLVTAAKDSKGGLSALRSKVEAERAFNVLDDVYDHLKERDPQNSKAYISMLEELKENNVIDLSWIAELRDISEGTDTGFNQKVLDASRIMAHLTEVNNRILTAIASYDLAMQQGGATHESAVEQAKSAVSETQFNYSSPNKPRLFQPGGPLGKFGPAVFQFMQWPQHMYALMIRNFYQSAKGDSPIERQEARRLLYGLFATHLAAGGVLGAALQPVKWAIGLTMMAFGDEDDTFVNAVSGESFDRWTTSGLTNMFGSEIGSVLSKGLPVAVGGDLSQRMSLGTVYYIDFKSQNAESALGSLALGLGGASLNLAANMWRGAGHFVDGNYQRAIESASPKILRDVVRTHRYWNEGLVNNAGDTVISAEGVEPHHLFLQSLGVQPFVVSQFYQGQQAIKDTERFYRDRKSDILRGFRNAKTSAERAQVRRDVAEFNRRNPAIRITRSQMLRSKESQRQRERRFRRYGANIDERAARQFAKEADPYR